MVAPSHVPRAASVPRRLRGPTARAYLGLAVAVLLWGTLHPVAKVALHGVTPAQFTFLRAALAGLALLLVCAASGRLHLAWAELLRPRAALTLGLVAFAASNHLSMASLAYLPAGANVTIAGTSPLFAALGSGLAGEPAGLSGWLGATLGFVGVAVLADGGGLTSSALPGLLMALGGAAAWSAYTLLGRRLASGHDPLALTAVSAVLGAVPLGLLAAGDLLTLRPPLPAPGTAVAVLWCATAGTAATYTLWTSALRHLPASRVAPLQYLNPPMGIFFSWLLLGEQPSVALLSGGALILLGVALAQRPWRWR